MGEDREREASRGVVVGFHTFRATLAIREQGWSLEQVRVFLGYSSRMTTDRYYAHPVSSPGGPTRNKLKNEGLRCSVLAP